MSVSAVSAANAGTAYQSGNSLKEARDAFKQMEEAIQKGDLAGAQNAYSSLASLLDNGQQSGTADQSSSNSATGSNSKATDVQSLLDQIGSALQNNDLNQAQTLLQTLQQTAQTQGARGHHGHPRNASGVGDSDALATAQTQGSTSSTTGDSLAPAVRVNITV